MKLQKISYFPYLPNSRIEDNKRYKHIRDIMEKNPFTFHKKKNSFIFDKNHFKILETPSEPKENINENNINSSINNNNQEILIFQKEHDKYINLFNNFIKNKSSKLETNAQNYLHFLMQNKKLYQLNNNLNNKNTLINNNLIYSNNNTINNNKSIPSLNKSSSLSNIFNNNNTISISNEYKGRKHFILGKKSPTETDIFSPRTKVTNKTIESERDNFIANNIKTKNSDITNPFFYNGIAKEIIKLNQETMDYNKKESEKRYLLKKNNLRYSNNDLPLSPEKMNNPNYYYSIGETSLEINPIINKGHYSMSYSKKLNNFKRQKSDFY